MFLLTAFAFLAGIITVLSPCILPVLPIVLSSSLAGGKKRPFGVVSGFVLSFTLFTLFLTSLVKITGLSANFLRSFSIVIIFFSGLSLILPQLQALVEKIFSQLSSALPTPKKRQGFVGGFLIGLSLGLLWTPCVGPILASVITLAATAQIGLETFLITLAYSLGTGLPLLAITYGGQKILNRVGWLTRNTRRLQQTFGLLMILTALGIFFNLDRRFQTYLLEKFPGYGAGLTQIEDNDIVKKRLAGLQDSNKPMFNLKDNFLHAPELIVGGQWFNSPPLNLQALRGKVVLVDFWTYTCINCIRTLPYLNNWHQKYAAQGLVIIGVHTPEFEFEKTADNVAKAIKDFGLQYPIMQDNNYATWQAYSNRYWPAKYFIDKDGRIRHSHFGEGDYDESEKVIQELLKETGVTLTESEVANPTYQVQTRTPELYLGYARISALASPEDIISDTKQTFSRPEKLPTNSFYYQGDWLLTEERAIAKNQAVLGLNFEAKEVFLVMRPTKPGLKSQVKVYLDDQPVDLASAGDDVKNGIVTVDSDRLYRLVRLNSPGKHLLRLEFLDGNLELYAFTFG